MSTDAVVYANGAKCGAIGWPYGEVDISKAVKAGSEAMLWIQVIATSDDTPSSSFLDPGRVVTTAANLQSKGLIGDVFLRSRPSGTHISDVFLQTSTRKKELKLDIEVSDLTAAGPVQFTAKLLDAKGTEEKRFQGNARMNGNGTQVVQLAWRWDDPRLWDLQQPNLYTLKLEAKGTDWDDEYAQPFGFREFWIEGRRFFLNGTEIRLRPTSHTYMETCFGGSNELTDAHIDGCMVAGFNIEECWPTNHDGACNGDVYNVNCYLNLIPLQEREEWLSQWVKSGDMPLICVEFGTPWKYTFLQGRWGFEASTEPMATEYCAIYSGAEAYATETTDYRRAIRQQYKGGQQFGDMGANWNTVIDALPAFQKLQALFNRNTYRSWRTWGITGGMIPWDYGHGWDTFYNERRRKNLPTPERDLHPFTPGMRGIVRTKAPMNLVKPFQPGGMDIYPAGVALMDANGPTLAWIAGGQDAFTSKDHSFTPGQNVEKQVVLINDERTAREYHYTWTANLGGERVATDSGTGRIDPATTLFRPLQFRTPSVTGTTKATGTIELVATIGSREHKDVFSFRVFPKPDPLRQNVAVYDPAGKSTKMLAALGCRVQSWSGKPSSELIVIGREALFSDKPLPFDLEAAVDAGARVLICAQDPQWLRTRMGFRVAAHLARRVFPVSTVHPVCQGLDRADLTDWSGESTLVEAKPRYSIPNEVPGWRSPDHGWHWGNRGVVTSAAIEKPHRSGWRPILECEFDLAYSPLMELDYGRGRLVLCTLDLEDHVALDPAAAVLARNIVQYAATAEPIPRARRTILVGDDNDRKALENLGVLYQAAAGIEPDADLTIIGSQTRYNEADVRNCLVRGGSALFLSRSESNHGFGVELEQTQSARGSIDVPAWPECRGLSPSDLHWRTEQQAWLVASGVEKGADGLLGVLRDGKGVAVFCQIDPDRFQVEQKPYFRLTRWRQTRALAQILANLGASFAKDRDAFRLTSKQTAVEPGKKGSSGWYHPDYRGEFNTGDDPYRYFRW